MHYVQPMIRVQLIDHEEVRRQRQRLWKRNYLAKHPDRRKESTRKYRQSHAEAALKKNREYRSRDPEKWKQYKRDYVAAHPTETRDSWRRRSEKTKAYSVKYRATHPEKIRAQYQRAKAEPGFKNKRVEIRLMANYGLTLAGRDAMFAAQGKCCAVCRSPENIVKKWHIDHDHLSGMVRGILCHNCNVGLGHFRDDAKLLSAAIDYLEKQRAERGTVVDGLSLVP